MDPRLETVNMAQSGYGIDQAFLWYARDGRIIDHAVHIFAFITLDVSRMKEPTFLGYPKPVLSLRDSGLAVGNVPVPRRRRYVTWAVQCLEVIKQLRSAEVFRRVKAKVSAPEGSSSVASDSVVWQTASRAFETLRQMNDAQRSTFVLVYLPGQKDYEGHGAWRWRRDLRELSKKTGMAFVDLIEELRTLTAAEADSLFNPTSGHYSIKGNQWVAQALYRRITAIRDIAAKLTSVN
jgi:hypothetical protein